MREYGLGAIPVPRDPRDFLMRDILPVRGAKTTRWWPRPIMLDQSGWGTCVANAWTHFLTDGPITHEDLRLLDPEKQPSYAKLGSRAYWDADGNPIAGELYAVRLYDRIHDGVLEPLDPGRKAGCQTDHGAKILQRRGLVGSYYRAASVEDVIDCLLNVGPVVFASPWYGSMYSTVRGADDHKWVKVDPSTGIRGYHAYLLDGVNLAPKSGEPFVRLHNSWGIDWGEKGIARVAIDDLHTLFIQNAWIATELPTPEK